jgi:hypothetical protein
MASEILGLFTTPDQYNLMQQQATDARALQYAQLSPFQRAEMSLYRGGAGLGGAIGGIFGMQDPQLRMISQRQQLSQGLDMTNPQSIMQVAQQAADMGDMQFATALADYARKASVDIATEQAKLRERTGRAPALQIADEVAGLNYQREQVLAQPDSPEKTTALRLIDSKLAALDRSVRQSAGAQQLQVADRLRQLRIQAREMRAADANNPMLADVEAEIKFLEKAKEGKEPSFGVDREAKAQELYGTPFIQLDQKQRAQVNAAVEDDKRKVVAATPVPGVKEVKDIPALRNTILQTIDPFRKTVTAADSALASIDESLKTNNFAAYRAAQTQFARAISGAGDLSQKELKAAGADPGLLGGTADYLSTLFTSTPTKDTQTKIKKTLQAIRKVAATKGIAEIEQQRDVAARAGFNAEDFRAASRVPEFSEPAYPDIAGGKQPAAAAKPPAGKTPPAKQGAKKPQTLVLKKSGKVVTIEQE